MDEAPPYSPTASSSERRLPRDYSYTRHDDEVEELMRPRVRPKPHAQARNGARTDVSTIPDAPESPSYYLTNISTAPATLTIPPELSPSYVEPPPDYAPHDALAQSFRLVLPFVYTTKTSTMPRYQLMQEFTRSEKPRRLRIRRLMATESRRHCSLPSPSLAGPQIRYDEDGTMYSITSYEMRGHRSSTLPGHIKLETGGGKLSGGKWTKIWHVTKNTRRDSLNPDNDARLQKRGYQPDEEWDRRLLFFAKKGRWDDPKGDRIATEDGDVFEFVNGGMVGWRKDLLISCWVMRRWMTGDGLRWENDRRGLVTV
ncbi:hypothetical protein BDV96DRAFT_19260 [Lophiotrema nucula]|uniref:Uncharacterized protein n=1 Tax=Lophiotrema nucula TaxID=690887 RepID=A0A6A5ZD33_9PLEO|nr:hypothetical protein BDV96DRAFT_19260 [Lophiotrema nucula]